MTGTASPSEELLDTSYTDVFFRELSPVWLNYVAALSGATPLPLDRPFRYLELGCGFGSSAIVTAGAFPHAEVFANDLSPEHIAGAKRHAAALGVRNIELDVASFADLQRRDLPMFDFIVAHGVYSWVGAAGRADIRNIVQERLKPGGLFYVSYNCLPGWAPEIPVRRLLSELATTVNSNAEQRSVQAVQSLRRLSDSKSGYFTENPAVRSALDAYERSPPRYLAHEFLGSNWDVFYSIDVADELSTAGLSYLGSATLPDNHPMLVLDELAAQAITELSSARQRQLADDFAASRRFRRDVFVREPASRAVGELAPHLGNVIVGCMGDPELIGPKLRVPRGQISFQPDFIAGLKVAMARGSMRIADLVEALAANSRLRPEIVRNLLFLVAGGTLTPFAQAAQSGATGPPRRFASPMVERAIQHVLASDLRRAIPSEILGNGVEVRPLEALVITELMSGVENMESLSARTRQGMQRLANVQGVESDAQLHAQVMHTVRNVLPTLMRLRLIH